MPTFTPQEQGLIDYHRKNLNSGGFINQGGNVTTVYITGVTGPNGRIYNVPGFADGKILTAQEAAQRAARVGWQMFPSYATGAEADAAAERTHKIIEDDLAKLMGRIEQGPGR